MTAQNQRDPDGTDILGQVRDGLADLKANVISRWGRIPTVTADPATLVDGMLWMRSDKSGVSVRSNGATSGLPLGFITQSTSANVTAGIGAVVDLLTVTFTALAGRRYLLTAYAAVVTTVAVTNWNLLITDNTPTTLQQYLATNNSAAAASNLSGMCQIVVTPAAGSVTYRARVSAVGGTVTLLGTNMTHFLRVDDIGPA